MAVLIDGEYDRERLALYVAGLLPDDQDEAQAVLDLTGRLLPILRESRATHTTPSNTNDDQRDDG